jgi:hypothetical protein
MQYANAEHGLLMGNHDIVEVSRLGIGVSSPARALHVQENSANVLIGNIPGCGAGIGGIGFGPTVDCGRYSILGDGTHTVLNRTQGGYLFLREGNSDQLVLQPGGNVQVAAGDVAVGAQGRGVILKATDGPNCFRLTVNNAGALVTALVPCP